MAAAAINPFPGMNPYLEDRWLAVHARLVPYLADALQRLLPEGLHANLQERVYVEAADLRTRWFSPDVHVSRSPQVARSATRASASGGLAVREPKFIHLPKADVHETYIEIIDTKSGGAVVTIVEVVSPSNKIPGSGRRKYLQKQREVTRSRTSLVEIDLIRGGKPVTLARPEVIPPDDRTEYHVSVRRGWRPSGIEYYGCPLREPLPRIKVPLRRQDADASIELQSILDQLYENAGYADTIDYTKPPIPALEGDAAAWATDLLRTAGLLLP